MADIYSLMRDKTMLENAFLTGVEVGYTTLDHEKSYIINIKCL